MKVFFKKYWHGLFALYLFIYLPWFLYLEQNVTEYHIIHCRLDDYIPFNEYFIIPYLLWFFYVIGAFIYLFFKAPRGEFLKFAITLVSGMTISLIICTVYPNGLHLRPNIIGDDNIFCRMVAALYGTDTATNVFPSVHVLNSLVVHFALAQDKFLDRYPWVKTGSGVLCILIILSTLFLKQHSVLDVLGAFVIYAILYLIVYAPEWKAFSDTSIVLEYR
jgi:membrane-associated phospholipid phosphatase